MVLNVCLAAICLLAYDVPGLFEVLNRCLASSVPLVPLRILLVVFPLHPASF